VPGPSLGELTRLIFRVSNTTFGGGYITMAALKRELVNEHEWITDEDYALTFALARITPGTNIIAFCAGVGSIIRGVAGAFAAATASTVPAAVMAVVLMEMFDSWQNNRWMSGALGAALAAACGMLWAVVITIVRPAFVNGRAAVRAIVLVGAAFATSWFLGWTPVPIIFGAAAIGYFWTGE
jgi:chromate transporter